MNTRQVHDGMMLVAEPVDCCGIDDLENLVCLKRHIDLCNESVLRSVKESGMELGEGDINGFCLLQEMRDRIEIYRAAYLTRRIRALEEHCGLVHNPDVDTSDIEGMI